MVANYKIKLIHDDGLDTTIEVSDDQTIFEAAENLGIDLPASC